MTEGMEQFVYLGWNSFVNTNSTSIRSGYASGNSYISKRAKIGKGTYVEDSYVHHGTVIGTNCVVSGVTLDGQNIPDGAVIHGLKLGEEQFVARMYGVMIIQRNAACLEGSFQSRFGQQKFILFVAPCVKQ